MSGERRAAQERLGAAWGWLEPRLRRLPRPTPSQLLRASPVVLLVVGLAVLLLRNHDTVDFPHYEVPEGYVLAPPPTSLPPGAQLPLLVASVPGTTIREVPANVGTAALEGTVQGPLGPVAGAIVRIERSILGEVQAHDVATDAAGQWRADGLGGGRYRVRAFLPPTLASRRAEVFLLPAGERRSIDLTVEEFVQPSVAMATAPAPALVGQPVNVGVRVTARFVDENGFVGTQGVGGASVDVVVSSSWTRLSVAGPVVSDSEGQATITFTCRQAGSATATATVRTTPTAQPLVAQATFECIDPASLTTTTQPGDGITPPPTATTVGATTTTTFPDVGD